MSYKKGRKNELVYKRYLESLGYFVEAAPKGNKFTKQKDFFGWWDLIAHNGKEWLLVQVKTNSTSGTLKKLREQAKQTPKGTFCELAIKYDGKRGSPAKWRVINLKDKTITITYENEGKI